MDLKNKLIFSAGWLCFLLLFASCGGGGSGGGGGTDFSFTGSGFGFSDLFGNTTGSGTSNQYPILDGVNLPLVLYFNEELDPATVNSKSIDIRTITVPEEQDPDNLVKTPGGIQANVEFRVSGATLYIIPTLTFNNADPVFGFTPFAAYEIKFAQEPAKDVVTSISGKPLVVPLGQPIAFITTDTIYDQFSGTPEPSFYYYDPDKGSDQLATSWVLLNKDKKLNIPLQPPPRFRVFFSEPVLKVWAEEVFLVNSSDHTSDALSVRFWKDAYTPVPIPGLWYIFQTTNLKPGDDGVSWSSSWLWENPNEDPTKYGYSYVEFQPNPFLLALPSDIDIRLTAKGVVADLAGNTKGGGVPGTEDFREVHSVGTAVLDDVEEQFFTKDYEDTSASSALWGGSAPEDFLKWAGGGGNGIDGKFYPPDFVPAPNDPAEPDYDPEKPVVIMDEANKIVYLSTATFEDMGTHKEWKHYEYQFTSFTIPFGWTVEPTDLSDLGIDFDNDVLPDRMDLSIFVTGLVKINGTLNADGGSGESRKANWDLTDPENPEPDPFGTGGGISYAGGSRGGMGGSIPTGTDSGTLALNSYAEIFETFASPDGIQEGFKGITGISTEIGDYWLRDSLIDFNTIVDTMDGQVIQPNVGVGPEGATVATNRPTFFVDADRFDPQEPDTIWIVSDENDPRYRGKFTDESYDAKDPFTGKHPPIAEEKDTYIIGFMRGSDGERASVFDCAGKGGDPLTVAQNASDSITVASAGGGSGAGGTSTGVEGQTGPDLFEIPLNDGGNSAPDSLGGATSKKALLEGTVESYGTETLTIKIEEEDLAGVTSWDLLNYRINPNIDLQSFPETTNDWEFTIESAVEGPGVNQVEITVLPIQQADGGLSLDLTDPRVGTAFGATCRILPPQIVGGSGGGGSGIELTGTAKQYAGQFAPPNSTLPYWYHGAGGGAGGGAIIVESAKSIQLTASGRILARGGQGGILSGVYHDIPAGGGGSGGCIVLRAREDVQVKFGGLISVQGGPSLDDPDTSLVEGRGGFGFLRFETFENQLLVESFSNGRTEPEVADQDLGAFVPVGIENVGFSKFYPTGVIEPKYLTLKIYFRMLEWDSNISDFVMKEYVFPDDTEFFEDYEFPPFEVYLNSADAIAETGFLDITTITDEYLDYDWFFDDPDDPDDPYDPLLHKPYFRFKIILRVKDPLSNETYKNPEIDLVAVSREQQVVE